MINQLMVIVFTLVVYYSSILMFTFVNKVMSYCLLLLMKALCCLSMTYLVSGFTWYSLLFYMVYMGGIYMLFIFVSVHLPKKMKKNKLNLFYMVFSTFLFWEFCSYSLSYDKLIIDYSFKFCKLKEGMVYLFLCLFLLLGFILISFISSSKESFIR